MVLDTGSAGASDLGSLGLAVVVVVEGHSLCFDSRLKRLRGEISEEIQTNEVKQGYAVTHSLQ